MIQDDLNKVQSEFAAYCATAAHNEENGDWISGAIIMQDAFKEIPFVVSESTVNAILEIVHKQMGANYAICDLTIRQIVAAVAILSAQQ